MIGVTEAVGTTEEGFWAATPGCRGDRAPEAADRRVRRPQLEQPTLLDLIEHVADTRTARRSCSLCLSRPSFLDVRRGWSGGKKNATTIFLEPLSEREADALIDI